MRILLIEDDPMIGASLMRGLRDDGYAVDWVRDGVAAAAALRDDQAGYVLALLDWGLPGRDGLSVLEALRSAGNGIPVLMITARDALADRVTGLDTGADDYLVKPFEFAELRARIRSLLRRRERRVQPALSHGELRLDPVTHAVKLRDATVPLSAREFALLYALLERPGAVLSRGQLEEQIYSWVDAVESNAVEFIIHGIRKKLGAGVIENVRGVGWRIGERP
ncbi:MAG: response regulator transcription factor [Gammaproteobacteria bacterium]|nr:response regulator transcription factor [Gammaproteobacteria bacterium]MDE2252020.1 response regulator transcription factor [Gammaproteobacteria bacterium]